METDVEEVNDYRAGRLRRDDWTTSTETTVTAIPWPLMANEAIDEIRESTGEKFSMKSWRV